MKTDWQSFVAAERAKVAAELETLREGREELVRGYPGKFVLIHGKKIEVFDSECAALNAGRQRYPEGPFLVEELVPEGGRDELPGSCSRRRRGESLRPASCSQP